MRPNIRTYIVNDAGERVFGPGPAEILRRIREQGSLRAASISMGMAYTKALALIRNAERAVGVPLTTRVIGGPGGGGSTPTPEADALLEAYERWTASIESTATSQFTTMFAHAGLEDFPTNTSADSPRMMKHHHVGVAVMAAGHAQRFGSQKLIEPLLGEPVLSYTLSCIPAGLPMVVASNSVEVDALCEARGIDYVRPQGPLQGDSVSALTAYAQTAGWDGCIFLPGDQPLVEQGSIRRLIATSDAHPDACVRLSWRGRSVSPSLFPSSLFESLTHIEGDVGGSVVLTKGVTSTNVEAMWPWELWDIDTPTDLARIREIVEAGLGRAPGK